MTIQEQLVDILTRTHDDPALFATAVLRVKLREWQRRFFQSIRDRLARGIRHLKAHLRTCHGAGKTFAVACLVLWLVATRPEARALTTAPTWDGVERLLWSEIARVYNGSLLRDLKFGTILTTQLRIRDGWYAIGASSDRPENLEGHHSPVSAMRIVDEAKAVPDEVFTATQGLLDAPETFDIWISTPSIQSGKFFERDVNGGDDVLRVVVTIDDLIAEGIPGKAEWKANAIEEYGGETAEEYRARAYAEYMNDAEGALFPLSWVDRAMAQEWTVEGPLLAGFDVAGSQDGDESVVAVAAIGPELAEVKSLTCWRERDTMISKGRARVAAGGVKLRVDGIGLGKGVLDSLVADGYPAEEYRASDKPHDTERFANRKAEDAWGVRRRLENGTLRLPADRTLKAQLVAMKYKPLPSGKLQVIDPSDSPDRADGVIIALAGRKASKSGGWLELIERENASRKAAA
ncbi:MAG: hypothetical protein IPQ07_41205 [Myxococcales bacterium]|nr:hypothetical protein [Myxococcales bacterium]